MEDQDIAQIAAQRGAGLERARRRRAVVDLAIALVDREHEIIGAGERDGPLEIGAGRRSRPAGLPGLQR